MINRRGELGGAWMITTTRPSKERRGRDGQTLGAVSWTETTKEAATTTDVESVRVPKTHARSKNLTKYYDDLFAVDDVSFRIEEGEFATLLGPSGCGKSTTLHMIAGLVEATSGTVHLRGNDVSDTEPYNRNIGLVFQHSALFPT